MRDIKLYATYLATVCGSHALCTCSMCEAKMTAFLGFSFRKC